MVRKLNFNPGPSALPLPVLEKVRDEFLDFQGTGMSIVEISHRSKDFEKTLAKAKENLRKILTIPETYEIIFVGGGASLQFSMVPMNFLAEDKVADYVCTGEWAQRAIKEAKMFGKVNEAASSEKDKFRYIPKEFKWTPDASYVHITTNNTIYGSQWHTIPEVGSVPLIADMSSDFMSHKFDVSKFVLIYAGAQKNIGPAGVTVAIVRKDFLSHVVTSRKIPTMLQYKTHVEKDSLYNTPPVFGIYIVEKVTEWALQVGGLAQIEEWNRKKTEMVYGLLDSMSDFYKGMVQKDSRSSMNVTFNLPSEELEKKFVKEAEGLGFVGLAGHRALGGLRISMYNAVTVEAIATLCQFMTDFAKKNKK